MDSMRREVGLQITNDLEGHQHVVGIYGKEAMFDCYRCDIATFNRKSLRGFFGRLVKLIGMEKGDLHFWDDVGVPENEKQTRPETTGTSAVQFILTSNITVHCLDKLGRAYVNIFSCKDFDEGEAGSFVQDWFKAFTMRSHVAYRQ